MLERKAENMQVQLIKPDLAVIDFKEAILVSLLGLLRKLGQSNSLCSVTGAEYPPIGGAIYSSQRERNEI
jgi:anhydro-N-acetylmuramic acid kinase